MWSLYRSWSEELPRIIALEELKFQVNMFLIGFAYASPGPWPTTSACCPVSPRSGCWSRPDRTSAPWSSWPGCRSGSPTGSRSEGRRIGPGSGKQFFTTFLPQVTPNKQEHHDKQISSKASTLRYNNCNLFRSCITRKFFSIHIATI